MKYPNPSTMLKFPPEFLQVISIFSSSFRKTVWQKSTTLLIGAICCPGSRTVCNVLRAVGRGQARRFDKYHRVLSRDRWSAFGLGKLLLNALVDQFIGSDRPLVFGIDETIERRWGAKINKRGIYRDPVRSSSTHLVKCSGLRWMSIMLLTGLPWLQQGTWALPVLTALCPSERFYKTSPFSRSHKTLSDWSRQLMYWLARYAKPFKRPVYLVGDGTYATYELMIQSADLGIGLIARMRLDARLFHFPPPQPAGKRGRKPKTGNRILRMCKRLHDGRIKWEQLCFSHWYGHTQKQMLITHGISLWDSNKGYQVPVKWVLIKDPTGHLDPILLACSDLTICPANIVNFFVRRWRVEVTFAEVRRHLGVETQRQWSDLAIERTTPVLLALKSIITLMANQLFIQQQLNIHHDAWYQKRHFTFSDILVAVRQHIWAFNYFPTSTIKPDVGKLKATIRYLCETLTRTVA